MSRKAQEIISKVIACAGGWAEAPGEKAVEQLEGEIDEILEGVCNSVADDPTQWNPQLLNQMMSRSARGNDHY